MLFPTLNFGLFFVLVFAVSWALAGRPRLRIAFLCLASYVFYGWWDWRFVFLLGFSTCLNYLAGRLIAGSSDAGRRRFIVGLAVAINLALLGLFKYAGFFADAVNDASVLFGGGTLVGFLAMALPIGISFYTFHGISYLVDLYRGTLKKPASFLNLLLYISFFPQLVAGPIVRASHFLPQIGETPDPGDIRATRAFLLILGGLFKKMVVANYLSTDLVDPVFFDPASFGAADLLFATYGYALQIYCDFSAYTDIAIGVAALLGFRFPQNFNQPYRSAGLREFWQRWHISLSTWLRDYLYIPLGGNRGGWKRYRNLMITMLLGGLWHGAAWHFVIWGGMHGAALVTEHVIAKRISPREGSKVRRALAIIATFHFVCLTWIFFRSADLPAALDFLAGFARWDVPLTEIKPLTLCLLVAALASQFLPPDRLARIEAACRRWPVAAQGAVLGLAIILLQACAPEGVPPFIYFQF